MARLGRVIAMSRVVVLFGVAFLGQVVTWDGTRNPRPFGVAIGAVIVALAAFSALSHSRHGPRSRKTGSSEEAGDVGSA